jgi:putative hemolysin
VTDAVNWEGWRFEIVDMDGKTIDKVLAMRATHAAARVEVTEKE